MTAQPYVMERDMMLENKLNKLNHEAAQQHYVTKIARDIMDNAEYHGIPMREVENERNELRKNRLNLMGPRKEYEKKIKQAEKIQEKIEWEIERFVMGHWDDYPKIIAAFYKAVGIIPRTKNRVHNQVTSTKRIVHNQIKDLDRNLENLTDINNDLQSEYKMAIGGQYSSHEKKLIEDALKSVAGRIKCALFYEIKDLEKKLKTAEIEEEITGGIRIILADTMADCRKAFNDETRYSMQVMLYDRAEREHAELALNLQENLTGFNSRVLKMIETWFMENNFSGKGII